MHFGYQYIFIVRAVKDADITPGRNPGIMPPQEIMFQFVYSRRFKAVYLTPLGIHPAEHVLDSAVFATGIHGLKHNEQGLFVLGIQPVLKLLQDISIGFEFFLGFFFIANPFF